MAIGFSLFSSSRHRQASAEPPEPEPTQEEQIADLISGINTEIDVLNLLRRFEASRGRHWDRAYYLSIQSLRAPALAALRAAGKGELIDFVIEQRVQEEFLQTISRNNFLALKLLVSDAELDFDAIVSGLGGPRVDFSVFDGFTPRIDDKVLPYIREYEQDEPESPLPVPGRDRNSLLAN